MITVNDVFHKVGLEPSKPIKWGEHIPEKGTGVYVVSLSSNPLQNLGVLSSCKIKDDVFDKWKTMSPELNVNGDTLKADIEKELNQFWKSNQNILYIGESSSVTNGLSKRVKQFYDHQVGWKGPHTGGYWLKLLSEIEDLYVYYSICNHPRDTEFKMLMYYIEQSTQKSFYEINGLGMNLPFANLKVDFQKRHGIKNAVKKTKKEKSIII
jgi:hypothetical protein